MQFAIVALNSSLLILSVVVLSLLIATSSAEGRVASVGALLRLKVLAVFVIAGHALSIGNNPTGTASINLMFWGSSFMGYSRRLFIRLLILLQDGFYGDVERLAGCHN